MTLPARPDLDQLRRQARELLVALRAAEPSALALLIRHHPRHQTLLANQCLRLADAQLILAREHGFPSWPRLKIHVEHALMDTSARAERLVKLATVEVGGGNDSAYRQALALLEQEPGLAGASLSSALVLGDVDGLAKALHRRPGLLTKAGGPRGWPPLLYVCFSKFQRRGRVEREGLLACARMLLEAGADPNGGFAVAPWPDHPLGPLYGACGVSNFPAMATLLLDFGANPDDNESLYHAVEQADTQCLELLLQRGASPHGTNALNRALDRPGMERIRLLLDHGANPNEVFQDLGGSLHVAIQKGREVEVLAALVAHGADPEARRADGRTPYQLALHHGHGQAADYLAGLGVDTSASPTDRCLAACGTGDGVAARRLRTAHPGLLSQLSATDARLVLLLAEQGRVEALAVLLDQGFPVDFPGADGETMLHVAAWHGQHAVVETLLARGAPLEVVERQFGCTPLGWAAHGCDNWPNPSGDYPAVVRALLEAGADTRATNHWGETLLDLAGTHEPVADLLRAHGVLDRED